MAQQVLLFADDRGFLHASAESADAASALFERQKRREAVHSLLLREIEASDLMSSWDPSQRHLLAAWMIDRWPAMRAIGFAYRAHELGAPGDMPLNASEGLAAVARAQSRSKAA